MLNIHILQNKIDTLEELYPKITSWFVEVLDDQKEPGKKTTESAEFNELVFKYRETKGKILLELMDEPVFNIENEYLAPLRKKLQKLTIHGDPNIPDRFLDGEHDNIKGLLLDLLKPEIPEDKKEELAQDYRMSFSEYDYIYNKMRANLLIIKIGDIPESLERYIKEIRECLALWKHLAAATLLRTSMEISVQDLCQKNHLDELGDSNYLDEKYDFWMDMLDKDNVDSLESVNLKSISLLYQINLLCRINKFSSLQDECHIIRKKTNKVIHNEIEINKDLTMELSHRTFQLIHELYEKN